MNADTFTALLAVERPDSWLKAVEEGLERTLTSTNSYLVEPGLRVIRGGGKRLRPILTVAASMVDGESTWRDDIIRGAIAVELVHVGSLVHDDIMDNASERRGVPTVNAIEGPNHAVIVGDYLLARSGVEAATISKEVAQVLARPLPTFVTARASNRETSSTSAAPRTPGFGPSVARLPPSCVPLVASVH